MWVDTARGFVYLSYVVPCSKETLAEIRSGIDPHDVRMMNSMFAHRELTPRDHTPRSRAFVESDVYIAENMLRVATRLKISEGVQKCEQFLKLARGILRDMGNAP